MAFAEDLSQFFDTEAFADEAIFTLAGGSTKTVNVIFNAPTQETRIYETQIETDAPFLMCRSSDIAGIRTRSIVTFKTVPYKIEKISADGTGISSVYLKN